MVTNTAITQSRCFFFQIRSNEDKIKKIFYSITGPGADQDPDAGLFTMDRLTGVLSLTQPLDREKQAKYTVNSLTEIMFTHKLFVNLSGYSCILHCHNPNVFACVQFQAHAVAEGAGQAEDPMDIVVNVIDQNDNKPTFAQATYLGDVAEASPKGTVTDHILSFKICQNCPCYCPGGSVPTWFHHPS